MYEVNGKVYKRNSDLTEIDVKVYKPVAALYVRLENLKAQMQGSK